MATRWRCFPPSREDDIEPLIDRPIDVTEVLAAVRGPGRGGTVLFLGSVRRSAEDGAVTGIEYSAYEAMVAAEVGRILDEARRRWPEVTCVLQHRIGNVPTGDPSIVAAAAAPHRADAFTACRFVIDQAKERLPVWKKERFADGTARWREEPRAVEPGG